MNHFSLRELYSHIQLFHPPKPTGQMTSLKENSLADTNFMQLYKDVTHEISACSLRKRD